MKGSYLGSSSAPTAGNTEVSPVNVFSSPVVLARHDGYMGSGSERLVLHMGQNVPADIARELDVKLDDGKPETGILRNAATGTSVETAGDDCRAGSGSSGSASNDWNIADNPQNCNPTYLF